MKTEWRPIRGFEGLYEISSSGEIMSLRSGKLLSAKPRMGSGYVKADLSKNGIRFQTTVHRLVAETFLGDSDGREVNHKNGDKTDNRIENIEWCTRSENVKHSYYALGHNIHPIIAIHKANGTRRTYRSVGQAVRDGFASRHIYRALKCPQRTHKGYYFRSITHEYCLDPETALKETP